LSKVILLTLFAGPVAQIVLSLRRLSDKTNLSTAFITLISIISNIILSVVYDYISEADYTTIARQHCLMPEIGLMIGGIEVALLIGLIFGVIYHHGGRNSDNETISRVNTVLNKHYR